MRKRIINRITIEEITCSKSLSSAHMAACFQSIFDSNGRTQAFDSRTGMQPACNASRNLCGRKDELKIKSIVEMLFSWVIEISSYLNEPKRLPRGTKQNVEFWRRDS